MNNIHQKIPNKKRKNQNHFLKIPQWKKIPIFSDEGRSTDYHLRNQKKEKKKNSNPVSIIEGSEKLMRQEYA